MFIILSRLMSFNYLSFSREFVHNFFITYVSGVFSFLFLFFFISDFLCSVPLQLLLTLIWPQSHMCRSIYSPVFWFNFSFSRDAHFWKKHMCCYFCSIVLHLNKTLKNLLIPSFESLNSDVLRKPFHFRRRVYCSCVSFIMDNVE